MTNHYGDAPGFIERLVDAGRRVLASMFRRPGGFDFPNEPCAGVREPRRRTPGGRSSAVAVLEPDPPGDVRAVGGLEVKRTHD